MTGHKNLQQLYTYLDSENLLITEQKEISKALNTVHETNTKVEPQVDPEPVTCNKQESYNLPGCKTSFICLFCKNLLVTKDNLPVINNHKSLIEQALTTDDNDNLTDLLTKANKVIADLLKPNKYFSEADITGAIV